MSSLAGRPAYKDIMRCLWLLLLSLPVGCGRMDFDPVVDDEDLENGGDNGGDNGGGNGGSNGGSKLHDRCDTAQLLTPSTQVVSGTTAGAKDDLIAVATCGEGPEVMLRFSSAATNLQLRFDAQFYGAYSVGTGCPTDLTRSFVCGPLLANETTAAISLDVTEETYIILSRTAGAGTDFKVVIGSP